ncbi:MAG: MotA/TolQ/ExbB proton channel family protein [Planctomycetes bacterium]|nr:MotA/TolQ/ExbB proton channel family protein [Planctomycetota bacterium]
MKLSISTVVLTLALAATGTAALGQNQATAPSQESGEASGQAPAATAAADNQDQSKTVAFQEASTTARRQLDESLAELAALNERIAAEKVPLARKLNDLEAELISARQEYQNVTRLLDTRTLDLTNLRKIIDAHKEEASYLSNLLAEYIRNFESRLHIVELQRYRQPLEAATQAPGNTNLTERQVFDAQLGLLQMSLDRLDDALGGTRFKGRAVGDASLVKPGSFALVGPAALFQSDDEKSIGTAEQGLGSLEPTIVAFGDPADAEAAAQLVVSGQGQFPLDPTLGNAHKVESTRETLVEHVRKGGPVMVPILALAGAAMLVALYKWLALAFLRKPSIKRVNTLLQAVARDDREAVASASAAVRGPVGEMLAAGVEHLDEPRELIEEVMYEKLLSTRLRLNRLLPFVAISASSAPLLGLLGTVTGIINTFKLITVFGSGDVKTLSGGISEALITTEFGLIVAIPSLLLYAFLSRKARGIVDQMEKAAIAFVNQVSKSKGGTGDSHGRAVAKTEPVSGAPDVQSGMA